jgi:phosphate:Na+ symporter
MTVELVGGIGVFLLGMLLLSDGLKAAAGPAVRRALGRFTGSRLAAVATGAAATAVIQSSTATTMTTIGLVAAGLLPLRNAIGVILGANLGTTSTAWIVAYFGLKLDISAIAMLAVAVGALLRLVGRDRIAAAGLPLAGFGLLFVGIGLMQTAMAGVAQDFAVPDTSGQPVLGAVVLVIVGAAMTIVMQSSSAAVATTLTALASGIVGLEQAAALVIGQNIGTTPKALLASLGATVAARRTAVAHILFNLGTGAVALAILPVFIWLGNVAGGNGADPAMTLAAFHTMFNLVGVALVLPWLGGFTRLAARLVPDKGAVLTRYLSRASADEPATAVRAARTTLLMCATELGDDAALLSTRPTPAREAQAARQRLRRVREALEETRTFLMQLRSDPEAVDDHRRHVSVLHALDHLTGAATLLQNGMNAQRLSRSPEMAELRERLRAGLEAMVAWCPLFAPEGKADHILEAFQSVAQLRRQTRVRVLRRVATGDIDPDDAEPALETLMWAQQLSLHLLRAVHHLREPAPGDGAQAEGAAAGDWAAVAVPARA